VTEKKLSASEKKRRFLQSQGVPKGGRQGSGNRNMGMMTRDGQKVPVEKQLEAIFRMSQEQNQQVIKELAVHRRILSQLAGRLEGLIRVVLLKGVVNPQEFQDSFLSVIAFDKEAQGIMRVKDPMQRVARVALWNAAGGDEDRVPIKPFDVGLLEWLADPTSGMSKEERFEVLSVLDYVDDRENFERVLHDLTIVEKVSPTTEVDNQAENPTVN
jgi:hypothetical protein